MTLRRVSPSSATSREQCARVRTPAALVLDAGFESACRSCALSQRMRNAGVRTRCGQLRVSDSAHGKNTQRSRTETVGGSAWKRESPGSPADTDDRVDSGDTGRGAEPDSRQGFEFVDFVARGSFVEHLVVAGSAANACPRVRAPFDLVLVIEIFRSAGAPSGSRRSTVPSWLANQACDCRRRSSTIRRRRCLGTPRTARFVSPNRGPPSRDRGSHQWR